MTLSDYAADPAFLGFVACWVHDHRCPLPLVDWLLERGLEAAAEAARWAATEPDRVEFGDGYKHDRRWTGPFPTRDCNDTYDLGWYWFVTQCESGEQECDVLPWRQKHLGRTAASEYRETRYFPTAEASVVALLAEWAPEEVATDALA